MRAVLTPFNLKLQVFGSIIASQTINAYARDLFMYRSRNLGPENQAVETNLPPSPSPRGKLKKNINFDLHADHANEKVSARVGKLSRVRYYASRIPKSSGKWIFHRVYCISYVIRVFYVIPMLFPIL